MAAAEGRPVARAPPATRAVPGAAAAVTPVGGAPGTAPEAAPFEGVGVGGPRSARASPPSRSSARVLVGVGERRGEGEGAPRAALARVRPAAASPAG